MGDGGGEKALFPRCNHSRSKQKHGEAYAMQIGIPTPFY